MNKKTLLTFVASVTFVSLFAFPLFAQEDLPSLDILSPAQGAVVAGNQIELVFEVKNFTLDGENIGGERVERHGHIHILVDGNYLGQELDEIAVTTTTFTLANISPGSHKITAFLHNNDHSPFIPFTSDFVNVAVESSETNPRKVFPFGAAAAVILGIAALLGLLVWKKR